MYPCGRLFPWSPWSSDKFPCYQQQGYTQGTKGVRPGCPTAGYVDPNAGSSWRRVGRRTNAHKIAPHIIGAPTELLSPDREWRTRRCFHSIRRHGIVWGPPFYPHRDAYFGNTPLTLITRNTGTNPVNRNNPSKSAEKSATSTVALSLTAAPITLKLCGRVLLV